MNNMKSTYLSINNKLMLLIFDISSYKK